jgi:hypothetical protein
MILMDTAIILAGGKSTRMGFDKQLINIGDTCITDYIITILKPMFKNIIVVTNRPEIYKDPEMAVIEDFYKGYGPLGGIHAGLLQSQSMYNYIISMSITQSAFASPGAFTAFLTLLTRLSVLEKVPSFSAKAAAGNTTSANSAVSVRNIS